MPCGWIFAQIIGDRRSTKVAKIMVVHWHLTFIRRGQVCFPMHLYGKNVENFKRPPLEPLGQCCLNFIWSLTRARERKFAKIVAVHWPRWPPSPYMVKTVKNLLLQMPSGWIFSQIIGDGRLKWWSYIVVWPFNGEVKFASICICMGPIHFYGKTVDNFKWLLLWSLWAIVAQISCGAPLGRRTKDC